MVSLSYSSGKAVRAACRDNLLMAPTSGLAPTYIQANLIVLPSTYASDFRLLCQRNPVPCPLIAESRSLGNFTEVKSWIAGISGVSIAGDLDIRRDAPKYMVYENGELVKSGCDDIVEDWTNDHVAFLIGCSFSFESALEADGLKTRHSVMYKNVCMYRTNIPLCPAGVFTEGTYVVSMRPYKEEQIERVRDISRPYTLTHGEPLAWGWEAVQDFGIVDIDNPEWGDAPLTLDEKPLGSVKGSLDHVPVFWGCGVTPQEAVMRAGSKIKGVVMSHAPGYMIVLDCRDWDITGDAR